MTNGFALNHDKSLQITFICVKHQAKKKKHFLKDVESTVVIVFSVVISSSFGTSGILCFVIMHHENTPIKFWPP